MSQPSAALVVVVPATRELPRAPRASYEVLVRGQWLPFANQATAWAWAVLNAPGESLIGRPIVTR